MHIIIPLSKNPRVLKLYSGKHTFIYTVDFLKMYGHGADLMTIEKTMAEKGKCYPH